VGQNQGSNSTEELTTEDPNKSDPTKKKNGRKVTFGGPPLDQKEEQVHDDNNDDDHDGTMGINVGDGYASHAYYRELIAEGFEKRAPARHAPSKTAYFPIDDPVTRTLNASKYSAKATEYSITIANAFFASVTKATLDDAIAADNNGEDPETVSILLGQVQANMTAIEDMHRDRILFLNLTSDPNFSSTEKDFANNIIRNNFQP
jgi:hypothetical protein